MEQRCPQDCECSKHDYANRVREKPETLEAAILRVTTDFPYPEGGYTASEMKAKLEQLGWDTWALSWLEVYDVMCKVLGQPTRKEKKPL